MVKKVFYIKVLSRLIMISISILLAFILSEITLHFYSTENYYIWPPYFRTVYKPLSTIMPGIYGESKFLVNSKGIRGDEIPDAPAYKILTIGGSTTECIYLNQDETWPFLLQKKLINSTNDKVWVGNAGKSGNTARHNILQMRYLLQQFSGINAIVVLTGINDLTIALSRGSGFVKQNESEEELLITAFNATPIYSRTNLTLYKKTAIWHIYKKIKYLLFSAGHIENNSGRQYIKWRKHREKAKAIRSVLPDISQALEEYKNNLNEMINIANKSNIRLIFMTQPVLWKQGLSQELDNLLWLGGIGNFQKEEGKEYYSVDALSEGMEMYNKVLLKICQDRQVECIDLASLLPKDTSVFYDDCHFNESGSQKVSEILAQYILQNKPFK